MYVGELRSDGFFCSQGVFRRERMRARESSHVYVSELRSLRVFSVRGILGGDVSEFIEFVHVYVCEFGSCGSCYSYGGLKGGA